MLSILIDFLVLLLNLTGPIVLDYDLCCLAEERAENIAVYDEFKHNDYISSRANCDKYGEILGRTTGDVKSLYDAFVRSYAHCKVMTGDWDSIGIGVAANEKWRIIIVVGFCKVESAVKELGESKGKEEGVVSEGSPAYC